MGGSFLKKGTRRVRPTGLVLGWTRYLRGLSLRAALMADEDTLSWTPAERLGEACAGPGRDLAAFRSPRGSRPRAVSQPFTVAGPTARCSCACSMMRWS